MIVIPAIDLKDGKCVRLIQGKKEDATVYSDDPVSTALRWQDCGAKLLHIVDLDGAFSGDQKNLQSIVAIRKAVRMEIQVGGGIRDKERIKQLMDLGINRVILGTAAVKSPQLVEESAKSFPGAIVVGIDAKDGLVAIKGWVELSEVSALTLAKRMQDCGATAIVYTDISRDGMMVGPNFEAMEQMVRAVQIPVIASGGVSKLEDLCNLKKIEGLWGVITGKAIYTGAIDLKEAIKRLA